MRHFPGLTFRRLAADRRGVTAVIFAVSAVAMIGFVGMAAEGGTWYLEKRHGQNAADAAAIAGALALAAGQDPGVSGNAAATGSGESNVVITTGTFSAGTFTANDTPADAVNAVVTTTRAPLFAAAFIGSQPITISESAVAMVAASGPACVLAVSPAAGTGVVTFDATASVQATGCSVAANGLTSGAITGASASGVSARSLVSSGGCSGCTGMAPLTYQPQTPDPFAQTIAAFALPANTQCNNSSSAPVAYASTTPPTKNCAGLSVNANTLDLAPGTYVFYGASTFSVSNGVLKCSACTGSGTSGVTIIMTGPGANTIGEIDVEGNSLINLTAPAINQDFNQIFNGVLFYTDRNAAVGNSVKIIGNQNVTLGGVMYFPVSNVTFSGNNGGTPPTCNEIIGAYLDLTGASAFNTAGCAAMNALVPMTQSVRLVM